MQWLVHCSLPTFKFLEFIYYSFLCAKTRIIFQNSTKLILFMFKKTGALPRKYHFFFSFTSCYFWTVLPKKKKFLDHLRLDFLDPSVQPFLICYSPSIQFHITHTKTCYTPSHITFNSPKCTLMFDLSRAHKVLGISLYLTLHPPSSQGNRLP